MLSVFCAGCTKNQAGDFSARSAEREKTVDKQAAAWYNEKKRFSRFKQMKANYKAPLAALFLFAAQDALMASSENNGSSNDNGGIWSEDGVVHLPPVPIK